MTQISSEHITVQHIDHGTVQPAQQGHWPQVVALFAAYGDLADIASASPDGVVFTIHYPSLPLLGTVITLTGPAAAAFVDEYLTA